ncbi:MAG TPA: hypothetical protein VNN98_02780 [Rhizomicrobium sp.]|nr:hypothetical protein [Rhizomicrobium sp.]
MRSSLLAAAAALTCLSSSAFAVQDTPATINGVETVCTGVGSAKDDPRWAAYPIKIVLATSGGAFLANAHVSLSKGGKDVAGLDCDAPWILFKAPAGSYTATATLTGSGLSHSANVTSGSSQKEVTITFPIPSGPPSTPSVGQ